MYAVVSGVVHTMECEIVERLVINDRAGIAETANECLNRSPEWHVAFRELKDDNHVEEEPAP